MSKRKFILVFGCALCGPLTAASLLLAKFLIFGELISVVMVCVTFVISTLAGILLSAYVWEVIQEEGRAGKNEGLERGRPARGRRDGVKESLNGS